MSEYQAEHAAGTRSVIEMPQAAISNMKACSLQKAGRLCSLQTVTF